MDCPYCGAELVWDDYWMRGVGGNKEGDIYRCPNSEGFDSYEDAEDYAINMCECDTLEELLGKEGLECWENITCGSSMFSVCGSFYTDKSGELFEGYPC